MPKRGQLKGTPSRRAEFVASLPLADGAEHIYWPWSEQRDSYARVYVDGHKISAHRWVYEQVFGPLPARYNRGATGDDLVLHRCGVKGCVRPSHLYLGDATRNSQDALDHGQIRTRLSDLDVARIRFLSAGGVGQALLASAFGISIGYLGMVVRGEKRPSVLGIEQRATRVGRYGRRVLTAVDVVHIRRRCAEGAIQSQVAAEYGVTRVAINHIVHRKTWRDLPDDIDDGLQDPAVQT